MNKHTKLIAIAATTLTVSMFAFTGCSMNINASATSTSTNTDIEVVKDAGGNEYEYTHTTTTENGVTKESFENVPYELVNDMDSENITAVYVKYTDSDDWGEDLLTTYIGEDTVLTKGTHAYGMALNYDDDHSEIEYKIITDDGSEITYDAFDLKNLNGENHFNVIFYQDEDGAYLVSYTV